MEKAIDAQEIECAVLGDRMKAEASPLGEVVPFKEFYDYEDKYLLGKTTFHIPAPVDAALSQRLKEQAVLAFHALDLYGLARVDFLLDRTTGEAFLNEVNTMPGFTSISMYPRLWQEAGIPFPNSWTGWWLSSSGTVDHAGRSDSQSITEKTLGAGDLR